MFESIQSLSVEASSVEQLAAAGVGLAALAIAVWLGRRLLHPARREAVKRERMDRKLREQVARKAESAVVERAAESEASELSESGAFTVLQMMDALARGGNLAHAEKWAINAIHSNPYRLDIPLRLARLYYENRRVASFVALVEGLLQKHPRIPEDIWSELAAMGRELAPEAPIFQDGRAPGRLEQRNVA